MTTDRAIWILHGGPASKRRRWRHVTPVRVWHGRIPHRAGEQWFLDAFDHESKTPRSFALLDIHRVRSEAPP